MVRGESRQYAERKSIVVKSSHDSPIEARPYTARYYSSQYYPCTATNSNNHFSYIMLILVDLPSMLSFALALLVRHQEVQTVSKIE